MLGSLLLTLLVPSCPVPDTLDPAPIVRVDSSRHEITVTVGPFNLHTMPPAEDGVLDHGATHNSPVQHFAWPVEGWLRGFRFEVLDGEGRPLPRHLMHHVVILNFDRRQLLYEMAERVFGAGAETDDASIPRSIGIPFPRNTDMGIYIAWHNDTSENIAAVRLRLTMHWIPSNQNPRPVDVLPLYMDVNLTVGATNTFDLPPGTFTKAHEFTLSSGGRLLAVSGHLHDYGVVVRLEDAESGKVITSITPTRDGDGKVTGMGRRLFGIRGNGIKLRGGHRYRVVAEYNNTSGALLKNGGMAHMVGLFAPENLAAVPRIDPDNAVYQRDLESLNARGESHHGHTE